MVTVARKTPFLAVPEIGVGIMLPVTSCLPEGLLKPTQPQVNPVALSLTPRSTENVAADELTFIWAGAIVIEDRLGGITSDCAWRSIAPPSADITNKDLNIFFILIRRWECGRRTSTGPVLVAVWMVLNDFRSIAGVLPCTSDQGSR